MDFTYQKSNLTIYSGLFNSGAHLDTLGNLVVIQDPQELTHKNSVLILHGGSDISPSIYNHKPSRWTQASSTLSSRDREEINLAEQAIKLGIPIFGICRGAQLACALAGGSLIQHVTGHTGGDHSIITTENTIHDTTTCHHQMMNTKNTDHELLAWAAPSRSKVYITENEVDVNIAIEPEVIFFTKIKALAVQGHPEWMNIDSTFVSYCLSLVKEKLL